MAVPVQERPTRCQGQTNTPVLSQGRWLISSTEFSKVYFKICRTLHACLILCPCPGARPRHIKRRVDSSNHNNNYNNNMITISIIKKNNSYNNNLSFAMKCVFGSTVAQESKDKDSMFLVRLSYVELYNNQFRNLLERPAKPQGSNKSMSLSSSRSLSDSTGSFSLPKHSRKEGKIEVREDKNAGVFLSGPGLHVTVTTAQEALEYISAGNGHDHFHLLEKLHFVLSFHP